MIPVSAVIITFNEEINIARTLKSLDFCDEIIIVDSGSTDTTLELCKRFNCKILFRTFDSFGPQKRFAVEQAKNDWVLSLDADEVVSQELRNEIIAIFSGNEPDVQGFVLRRTLVFLNHTFRFSSQYKQLYFRLFNRHYGTFITKNPPHEGVEIKGTTRTLHNHVLHYSYKSLSDYLTKFNRYTTTAGNYLYQKGKIKLHLEIALRFPSTFIKIYIINLGFLDGYAGFVWALLSSVYPVMKHAKARECLETCPKQPPTKAE